MLTSPGNPEVGPSLKLMSTSRAFNDEALARLLLQALRDPQARRRMIGRLRPRLVGTPHPKHRLPRLRGSLIRRPGW